MVATTVYCPTRSGRKTKRPFTPSTTTSALRSRLSRVARYFGSHNRAKAPKTRGGVRILYFYDAAQIVVCSAAMKKPKKGELDRVIERALSDRRRYFKAKRSNQIEIIEETP